MAKQQTSKKGNAHARNTARVLRKYGRLSGARTEPAKAGKRKRYGVQERWDGKRIRRHGKI